MKQTEINKLARFGFDFERAGAHTSRTLMLDELESVLSYLDNPNAEKADYLKAIDDENCLSKRTQANRKLTYRDLVKLYTLEHSVTIFRDFLYFWQRDQQGRPLLALLCGYCRDSLLRLTAPFITKLSEGAVVDRAMLEEFIEQQQPGRLSPGTLKSTARNLNSSWTQTGHLKGRAQKIRACAKATPGGMAYALFLGYLTGIRGEALFQTEFAKLLDCPIDQAIELAEEASRRGWIVFKRVGKTIEVLFPNLLTQQEKEWLREQS
jgi:hypothetical protein